ncbi:MAG: hypothetical protein HUK02_02080 [Bacteroidaceae bacterium]|nr:hypothetical protein [Bacteroidaceae bacterium]
MKKILLFVCLLSSLSASAQMSEAQSEVKVLIADSLCSLERVSTQTEIKRGLEFGRFSFGGGAIRYIWGTHSRQFVDNPMPTFVINPHDAQLSDFAIIRLYQKKTYRFLPEPMLMDNEYRVIDLIGFTIELRDDESFQVRPQQRLTPGEYIFVNLKQTPHGELNDYYCYCFTII